jgi:uncharacterized lipoprotein YmbA
MNIGKEMKMKNGLIRILAILTLGVILSIHFGCAGSPPSRFYQLSSLDTTPPGMKPAADEPCVSIGIGPVKIPDYLDQTRIVTLGTGNQLTLAEFDRWAELLKYNLVRVLAKNLSTLLCTKTIVFFPWRGGTPMDYRIEMEVLRLDGSLGGNVSLEAWWMIRSGDGKKIVLSKQSAFTEAVTGKDYNSLVSAESRTVGLLSGEIAEAIKKLPK